MVWNISAECISAIILCIIWIYSRKGNPLPTLKNQFFQVCFLVTFFAITSNIASTVMLYYYQEIPLALIWIVTTFYFVTTPLMGVFYFFYVTSIVFENDKALNKVLIIASVPAAAYLVFVLINPATKLLFDIDPSTGYMRGSLISLTYIIFYIYCFACLFLVLFKGQLLDRSIRRILISFPVIAAIVIVIQQFVPEYILSGSAATCALLIIYLYLQNKQISIDHLTGLPNRHEFLKMLELKLEHHKNDSFAIIVLSLKNFKLINDKFGQQNGDRFLQSVSTYLASILGGHQLYRFSGDEFAILLGHSDETIIRPVFERLQHRMTLPWKTATCSCILFYALAVVHYPSSADSVEGLIDGIETTVAQAKQKPEHYSYCTPQMLEQAKRKLRIIEILRERLATNSFEVYYQPILSIADCKFHRAEALLRLNDTPIGPIYPSEFIPLAEDTGLIIDITYQVLDKVCKYIVELIADGIDILSVSVNFSSMQFTQEDISKRVFEIIESNGIPCSKVKIEITESVLIENLDTVRNFINVLHARGVRFALDDFGTGYSNISTVLGFPINTVKLDKSLVWSSTHNPRSAVVVRHMTAAFRQLGINILAEGVETEEQQHFVENCGCDMIQGFLYSKPVPPQDAKLYLGKELCDTPFTIGHSEK
ncbi:putative bifunctional diguanylate cyclase/phosphodiesterase [Christensenella hongkongensis]|uniref:putative bifunctional diguanylate cyclase/phosphodiesterase n=1 Tax=Christensenella hongkongensis TaxID=270498 RepID=UPI0026727F33|nr:EAL domain-containing protein [Christensenella hongkongensis]